jgi:hypothetical protein
VNYKAGGKY